MNEASLAVEATRVTKTFRVGRTEVQALRGASLSVARGEMVAVMGPSGCGKSTLLHALGGLLTPTSGRIAIEGEELQSLGDRERTDLRRRKLGFVFQRFNLFPALTADENVALQERLAGRNGSRRRELFDLLGLSTKRGHRPFELSGGEQQRVALARALVHEPAILLADEPTGSLDSTSSEKVLAMLRRVNRELSQTILLITHDREVAEAADRLVTMKDGVVAS